MDNPKELLPVVDEEGRMIRSVMRGDAHDGSKILHPVVHLHVFNSDGELYLQKRPQWKDIEPNKWDTAVGGHIGFGEDIDTALKREAYEEIGIKDFSYKQIGCYVFESEIEKELVYVHIAYYDGVIKPDVEELSDGRFWSHEDIFENIGKGVFTPNFESEYIRFFK